MARQRFKPTTSWIWIPVGRLVWARRVTWQVICFIYGALLLWHSRTVKLYVSSVETKLTVLSFCMWCKKSMLLHELIGFPDMIASRCLILNPYKPGIPFLGHRQTVQTRIRRRRTGSDAAERGVWSESTPFANGNFYQKYDKNEKYTRHPFNEKWTRPIDKDGKVH